MTLQTASPASASQFLGAAYDASETDLSVDAFARTYEKLENQGFNDAFSERLSGQVWQIATLSGPADQRQQALDDLIRHADAALGPRNSTACSTRSSTRKISRTRPGC